MKNYAFFFWVLCGFLNLGAHDIVDISQFDPHICIDCRYASAENYYQKALYPCARIFVDRYVAQRLKRIRIELAKSGIGIVILEGYRPPSVQQQMVAFCCADCKTALDKDACHYNKGLGVDISLIYLDGQPMSMPPIYEDFDSEEACSCFRLPAHVYHNLCQLDCCMIKNGFVPHDDKWWHFDLRGWDNAPCLDLEYGDLLQ